MKRRSVWVAAGGVAALVGTAGAAWRLTAGGASVYARYAEQLRSPLPAQPGIADLVRYAALAASSHNTQPWRFVVTADAIDVLPDFSRATPAVDPDNHHLFISLGCAMQNLAIAAAASGMPGIVTSRHDGGLGYDFSRSAPRHDPLLEAIPRRHSTRAAYDGRSVPAKDIEALQCAASAPGVEVLILTARPQIDAIRDGGQ